MGFTTIAMKYLSVAECALIVYTMPLWVNLLCWPLLGTRISWQSMLALVIGFAGLVTLFASRAIELNTEKSIGVLLSLAAAILFALGSILNRQQHDASPYALVMWQVGLACVPMAAIGYLFEQPHLARLTTPGWTALIYMALIPMALCYVTWFGALRHLSAQTASIGTLAVPVVGVLTAAFALGESLGAREIAAGALTLGGVWLALSQPRIR
jgi:drug/metabolite transporter (DMT)-like permease